MSEFELGPAIDDVDAERKVVIAALLGVKNDKGIKVDCGGFVVRGEIILKLVLGKFRELFEMLQLQPQDCGFLDDQERGIAQVSPKGIFVHRAVISGKLDLEHCKIQFPLRFSKCRFGEDGNDDDAPIILTDVEIRSFVLRDCIVYGGIKARRLRTIGNFRVQDTHVWGPVELVGARIGRNLALGETDSGGPSFFFASSVDRPTVPKQAIFANRVEVGVSFFLDGSEFEGEVSLLEASVKSQLSAKKAKFRSKGKKAFSCYRVNIAGDFKLENVHIEGQFGLRGAKIGGDFRANGASIDHEGDVAVDAIGIELKNDFYLGKGASVSGCTVLSGSLVKGQMFFDGTRFDSTYNNQWAIVAVGLQVGGSVKFGTWRNNSVNISECYCYGGANFEDAKITGKLELRGCKLLSYARENNKYLDISGTSIQDPRQATLQPNSDYALSLIDAQIGRLVMPDREQNRPEGIVNLSRAYIGVLEDHAASWPNPASKTDILVLNGMTYDFLANPNGNKQGSAVAEARLVWLKCQSDDDIKGHFKPQPWIQLAQTLSAQGHNHSSRQIIIEKRRMQRKRLPAKFLFMRLQDKILDATSNYGFKPWRTIMVMIAAISIYAPIWHLATLPEYSLASCAGEKAFVVSAKDSFEKDDYPPFNALAYSFDTFVPLSQFGYEAIWMVNPQYCLLPANYGGNLGLSVGWILYVLYISEVLMGIILTSLTIIGFTGLLRHDRSLW